VTAYFAGRARRPPDGLQRTSRGLRRTDWKPLVFKKQCFGRGLSLSEEFFWE